jgi:hypothetical protein
MGEKEQVGLKFDQGRGGQKRPMHKLDFDHTDYSVVVKNRAPPPKSWRWEIYRAGRSSPIRQSTAYFRTMVAASREGKAALKELLDKIST